MSQGSLRRSIGVVPQDTVLFNDTIGYNIAYGDLTAPEEDVRGVARKAQLDSSIANMPQVCARLCLCNFGVCFLRMGAFVSGGGNTKGETFVRIIGKNGIVRACRLLWRLLCTSPAAHTAGSTMVDFINGTDIKSKARLRIALEAHTALFFSSTTF